MTLTGSDPYGWLRLIRRARLGSSVKLVAFALASYANPDGTSVRPGNPRLVAVTELSDKTVRTALAKLRDLGLLERVREGSKYGRKKLVDEYRLTIPENAIEVLELLPVPELPDEETHFPEADSPSEPVDNPVDNPGSSVTTTGDPDPDPPGTPVTATGGTPGTPVTDARNTGNHYRPPTQRPTQEKRPTNKPPGCADHGADVEGASAPASDARAETNSAKTAAIPDCPECGVLLDPDGSCFVCRTAPKGIPA